MTAALAQSQGLPEIFNTDQGSQFTSPEWTGRLEGLGIAVSMDGKGRWMDNVFIGVFRFELPDDYSAHRAYPYFMSAWALDWCPADPKFIVAVFRNQLGFKPHVNETGYSPDGGLNWMIFPAVEKKEISKKLEYGTIAVSANSPDHVVWAPARRQLPHYTADPILRRSLCTRFRLTFTP